MDHKEVHVEEEVAVEAEAVDVVVVVVVEDNHMVGNHVVETHGTATTTRNKENLNRPFGAHFCDTSKLRIHHKLW